MTFIRSPYSGLSPFHVGPSFGLGSTTDQDLLKQLHALAVSIYAAQQEAVQLSRSGQPELARKRVLDVSALRDQFQAVAEAFRKNDPSGTQLSWIESGLLSLGTWIEQSLAALPGAIAALPKAIGEGLAMGAVPWVLLGLGALYFLGRARKLA